VKIQKEHEPIKKLQSVTIVSYSFGRGGAEMSLAILADELAKAGKIVKYLALYSTPHTYNFDWLKDNGTQLHVLNNSKNIFNSFLKLFRLLYREKPQLIYSSSLHANLICQVCGLLLRIPHIASVRNNPTRQNKNIFKRLTFSFVIFLQSCIIFISNRALNEYLTRTYMNRFRRKRFFILHNPIVTIEKIDDLYLYEKFKEVRSKIDGLVFNIRLGESHGQVINFVIVSRLVQGKGILETLEQIRRPFRNQRFHLSIYGAGPLENAIRNYINNEFINKNVVLKGFCADINKIYFNSDIIIFPSRSEGFGRSPFEALLRGNLVLCNHEVSIIGEFLKQPMLWNDYREPLNLVKCLEKFTHLEPEVCVAEVKRISRALSPAVHTAEFEKIANALLSG